MKTIVWDIDDTLNTLMFDFLIQYKYISGRSDLKYEDIIKNPPYEILNIDKDEYLYQLDEFRLLRYHTLYENYHVKTWFEEYGDKFNHIVLTSCPLCTSHISAQWLFKNFGKWIKSFNFIPSYREKDDNICLPYRTKQEFIYYHDVDIFIDDNPENTNDLESIGIKIFNPKQPWNDGQDWNEIFDELDRFK